MSAIAAVGDDASNPNDPHFEPLVILDEVAVATGEEDEDVLCCLRSKLYVFIKEDNYGGEKRTNYWKERGLGDVKILKHKKTGKCRLLMRQEKTLKVCANFSILPESKIVGAATPKSWNFHAYDAAGSTLVGEEGFDYELLQYAIKFKTEEIANEFKAAYETAQELNASSATGKSNTEAAAPEVDEETAPKVEESAAASNSGADDLDAMIAKRNRTQVRRRSVMTAENALADSDYDSDLEDVEEVDAEEVLTRFKRNEVESLSEDMAQVKVNASST
eukprot:Stramenopile-MAST_4_protein_3265